MTLKRKPLVYKHFVDYLDYAEHGPETLESDKTKEVEFDSALDEDVAAEIKKMGYEIVPQVGCSGYRIDIGVV